VCAQRVPLANFAPIKSCHAVIGKTIERVDTKREAFGTIKAAKRSRRSNGKEISHGLL
jgi:hypothetical protein